MHNKSRFRNGTFASFAVLAFSVGLLAGCGNQADKTTTAQGDKKEEAETTSVVTPTVDVVPVEQKKLNAELDLPGNLEAFQDVPIHAKVEGYISWIGVDRGSRVKKGDLMITVVAPEVDAKVKEASAKVSAADAAYRQAQATMDGMIEKQVEANAKFDADQLTYSRLAEAAKTPGAIAQNEVDMAQKTVEGDKARSNSMQAEVGAARNLVASEKNNLVAARNVLDSVRAMKSYLEIRAPFDGVITERNVHNGSIVAVDAARTGVPLVRIQEKDHLRLVVAVPESAVSGIHTGMEVPFTLPAYVGKTFHGTVARPGYALDTKTRTMPVELDVQNPTGDLEPGMFATVKWDVTRPYDTNFLPQSAVASDLKGTFVVLVKDGVAQRVHVVQGQSMGNLVEVIGDVKPGDMVALKATDELKSGTKVIAKTADEAQIAASGQKSSAGGE